MRGCFLEGDYDKNHLGMRGELVFYISWDLGANTGLWAPPRWVWAIKTADGRQPQMVWAEISELGRKRWFIRQQCSESSREKPYRQNKNKNKNHPIGWFSKLFCTEQSVTSVAKTWYDVAMVVELFVKGCDEDVHIWVCFFNSFYAFWSCD